MKKAAAEYSDGLPSQPEQLEPAMPRCPARSFPAHLDSLFHPFRQVSPLLEMGCGLPVPPVRCQTWQVTIRA